MPAPDLRLMRSFVAVATRQSFTRAAQDQHVAQQALSQQIRALEDLVGVKLLERNSRRVELTPAGVVFLEEAKRILVAADQAVERAVLASRGEAGRLRVVYTLTTAYDTVPTLLDACRTDLPGVKAIAREVWAEDLPRLLLSGRAEVGLAPSTPMPQGLSRRAIRQENLVALLPQSHPLSGRRSVRLRALKEETFQLWPREMATGFYDAVVEGCQRAGFAPRIDLEAAGNTVWSAISNGRGVGLTVASIGRQRPEGIKALPLAPPTPTLTIDVITPVAAGPLAARFLALAHETCARLGWLAPGATSAMSAASSAAVSQL